MVTLVRGRRTNWDKRSRYLLEVQMNSKKFYFPIRWKRFYKADRIEYGAVIKKGYDFELIEITDLNLHSEAVIIERLGECKDEEITNLFVAEHRIRQTESVSAF